jgi:hypothetical protein
MDHQISLNDAAALTARYRANRDSILKTDLSGLDVLPICETFTASSVAAILEQEGVAKLRVYYGMDSYNKVHAVLVGADDEGADILPESATSTTETQGVILEDAQRCPPHCPPASALNEE